MVDFFGIAPDDPMLDRIVECVHRHADPELILLFGSRANGDARDDSDYDLLLVLADSESPARVADAVRVDLSKLGIATDILTRSAEEYGRWQKDPGLLDYVVARNGRLLYTAGRVPQFERSDSRVREEPPQEGLAMWVRRGEADLRIAEQSLTAAEPVWDAIAFHAHACAEKFLKALIVQSGTFPPRTHDLLMLAAMQPELSGDDTLLDACRRLMNVLPSTRYPELPEPTPAEARGAVEAARMVQRIVAERLRSRARNLGQR